MRSHTAYFRLWVLSFFCRFSSLNLQILLKANKFEFILIFIPRKNLSVRPRVELRLGNAHLEGSVMGFARRDRMRNDPMQALNTCSLIRKINDYLQTWRYKQERKPSN